jgi:fermentation-respiration switch protein FrsA (DUF1100 family)
MSKDGENAETTSPSAWTRFRKHPLGRMLCWLAKLYLVLLLMLFFLENLLVYPATKFPAGDWSLPEPDFQDIHFQSADGTKLHAWYAPLAQPTHHILFLHGNGGNITHRGQTISQLREQFSASVFIFDYRGYGKSEGKPHEAGVMADARAARSEFAELEGIEESEIILLGRSMGGGVAVDLAAEKSPPALILQSTFSTLPDVAAGTMPWIPVRWLMRNRYDSLSKIKKYQGPVLMSHSHDDEVIPYELGRKLYDAVPGPTREFFEIHGRGHNDVQPREYDEALGRFLQALK